MVAVSPAGFPGHRRNPSPRSMRWSSMFQRPPATNNGVNRFDLIRIAALLDGSVQPSRPDFNNCAAAQARHWG
jgi:hypothetical protein